MKPYYDDGSCAIYHGDCRDVLPMLKQESVTLLWTDPPYGHGNHVDDLNSRLNEHRGIEGRPIIGDDEATARAVIDEALALCVPLLRRDCCCCCCCGGGGGPRPSFAWLAERMDRDGLVFFHSVIWDKLNPGLGWRYRRQHEMILIAHRSGGRLAWAADAPAIGNVISEGPPRERWHPNEKPFALVAGFVARHTIAGELILDPFLGAGVTLQAAKALGRRAIGIELEERYCEIAATRLSQQTLALA